MKSRAGRLACMLALVATVLFAAGAIVMYAADDAGKETPRSPGGTIPLPRAPLLKENSRLVDVQGLILDLKDDLKASTVSRPVFQPTDGLGYFILLENALLEKTLAATAHGERPVKVRGTITVFRGKNYLELSYAAVKTD